VKHFLSAVKFITVLPGGRGGEFKPARMIPYFPLVGLLLGVLAAGFDWAAAHLWQRPLVSLLDVVLLVILTGAFHIDGLGDTADGLFSHRSRERVLEIMKDSRIGAMGLVAVAATLAIKCGALAELEHQRSWLIFLIPGYSRAGILFAMRRLPYGRPGGGTGKAFFERRLKWNAFWGLAPLIGISLILGSSALLLNLGWGLCVAAMIWFYRRRIGCVTGDMLGAMVETTEAALFLLMAAGQH
jgi:adenosylcobinamide-GDP ribazoletransferase